MTFTLPSKFILHLTIYIYYIYIYIYIYDLFLSNIYRLLLPVGSLIIPTYLAHPTAHMTFFFSEKVIYGHDVEVTRFVKGLKNRTILYGGLHFVVSNI
jgi:hypothetical protein